MSQYPRPAAIRPHILVVNGRKVRNPVFIIGAPCSGTEMLARAVKRSAGFHITLGQRWVLPVVQAFARTPSTRRAAAPRRPPPCCGTPSPRAGRSARTAAWAARWPAARRAATPVAGRASPSRASARYGDASPDLLYCADSLVDAFPDARLVQIIRDGRDVVAGMLADPGALAWFRPGLSTWTPSSPTRCSAWKPRPTGPMARRVGGGQVRHALARHRPADGQAAHPAVRRTAGHAAL